MIDIEELRYKRGLRDGREGHSPSSTSSKYFEGFIQGRQERLEDLALPKHLRKIVTDERCRCD